MLLFEVFLAPQLSGLYFPNPQLNGNYPDLRSCRGGDWLAGAVGAGLVSIGAVIVITDNNN